MRNAPDAIAKRSDLALPHSGDQVQREIDGTDQRAGPLYDPPADDMAVVQGAAQ